MACVYRISELAHKVGLSRSTLPYYEKLGLLHGIRQTNGYRLYSDKDVQQVHLLKQLQAGGLTLKECRSFLDGKLPRSVLERRLLQVNKEIAERRLASKLLSALLGQGSLRDWHKQTDKLAPDALLDWLKQRGFSEQQTLNLKWLSKDMNEHEQYMADFMAVFAELDRWGPGSDADTLRALSAASNAPKSIVDIGCGKGFSTRLLVKHTQAHIVALDNEQLALDDLGNYLEMHNLENRVTLSCASMTEIPFTQGSFDLIWAEASAYIMGVEQALEQWRP